MVPVVILISSISLQHTRCSHMRLCWFLWAFVPTWSRLAMSSRAATTLGSHLWWNPINTGTIFLYMDATLQIKGKRFSVQVQIQFLTPNFTTISILRMTTWCQATKSSRTSLVSNTLVMISLSIPHAIAVLWQRAPVRNMDDVYVKIWRQIRVLWYR